MMPVFDIRHSRRLNRLKLLQVLTLSLFAVNLNFPQLHAEPHPSAPELKKGPSVGVLSRPYGGTLRTEQSLKVDFSVRPSTKTMRISLLEKLSGQPHRIDTSTLTGSLSAKGLPAPKTVLFSAVDTSTEGSSIFEVKMEDITALNTFDLVVSLPIDGKSFELRFQANIMKSSFSLKKQKASR